MAIVINETSSCDEIASAIAALRTKQARMPAAWADRREAVAVEIDDLVDMWLARAECARLEAAL